MTKKDRFGQPIFQKQTSLDSRSLFIRNKQLKFKMYLMRKKKFLQHLNKLKKKKPLDLTKKKTLKYLVKNNLSLFRVTKKKQKRLFRVTKKKQKRFFWLLKNLTQNIFCNDNISKYKKNYKLKNFNKRLYLKKHLKQKLRLKNYGSKFTYGYYFLFKKQYVCSTQALKYFSKFLLRKVKPKRMLRKKKNKKYLKIVERSMDYFAKTALLEYLIFLLFPGTLAIKILNSLILYFFYKKSDFVKNHKDLLKFFKNSLNSNDPRLAEKTYTGVKGFNSLVLGPKSFLKSKFITDFIFKTSRNRFNSLLNRMSNAYLGVRKPFLLEDHSGSISKEIFYRFKHSAFKYFYTKAKFVSKHYYTIKKKLILRQKYLKVKNIVSINNIVRSKIYARRLWFPLYKRGKYWQRFRKKPYNWTRNDWKNKFFRFVKRPLTSVPTHQSKDVEKRSIYRSKSLKNNRFRTKFILKRYLRKTLFNNKLSSVNQFLRNKYKKKKCTFWDKIYQYLLGRMDAMLCWYGYAPNILKARKMIFDKKVFVNGSCVTDWKFILKPSDVIYVRTSQTLMYDQTAASEESPLTKVRRLKHFLVLFLAKQALYLAGLDRGIKEKMYDWWAQFLKNLYVFKNPRGSTIPKWVLSFFTKKKRKLLDYNVYESSRFLHFLNTIYFRRAKNFMYQRKLNSKVNAYRLHKTLNFSNLTNEFTARLLSVPIDRIINKYELQKDKHYRSVEQRLAYYGFNYSTAFAPYLSKLRYNSVIYKSTTNTKCIDSRLFSLDSYFVLSRLHGSRKELENQKDIYMFYLSRVFY